jgi:hypothetical protein
MAFVFELNCTGPAGEAEATAGEAEATAGDGVGALVVDASIAKATAASPARDLFELGIPRSLGNEVLMEEIVMVNGGLLMHAVSGQRRECRGLGRRRLYSHVCPHIGMI